MTQEQIKAKAKEYFPNDEFKQQAVIDAINWATKELEKENAELQHKVDTLQGFLDRDVEFDDLQKENAELKCECRRCVYSDCPCILSDYGKDRNGICDHFKDVFDENAELKGIKDVATLIRANNDTVITLMQLNNMLVSKNQQLTNAKEIIKGILEITEDCKMYKNVYKQANQFLNSEVEK